MRQLRRTPEVSKEFNEVYRALTVDAKLGHDWADLLTTKSVLLRLVRLRLCTACCCLLGFCSPDALVVVCDLLEE